MLDPIIEVLAQVLAFFYNIIPNVGISIILLTIFINLLLFPLTLKQTRSMRAMTEIQPEVKKLQKEYKDDREKLNQELMALYKERGVNPAAGCLPILIQMPIWFALFRLLREPEAYLPTDTSIADAYATGEPSFLGMVLSRSPSEALSEVGFVEAIPYLLIVIFVVVTGFYQQRQATMRRKPDGEQSDVARQTQTLLKVMPLVFGFFSFTLPAGVDLYFAAGQVFRIGQQTAIFRLDDRHEAEKAAAAGDGAGGPGGKGTSGDGGPGRGSAREKGTATPAKGDETPAPERPKPQPSSKKKKRRRRRN